MSEIEKSTPPRMRPIYAIAAIFVVLLAIGGYIALCKSLGVGAVFGGFIFLLYWGAIAHADKDRLMSVTVSAIFGLLLAYLLHEGPARFGTVGLITTFAFTLVVLYCQLMRHFLFIVNPATMLFLTLGTIPIIAQNVPMIEIGLAVILAALYFGIPAIVFAAMHKRRNVKNIPHSEFV